MYIHGECINQASSNCGTVAAAVTYMLQSTRTPILTRVARVTKRDLPLQGHDSRVHVVSSAVVCNRSIKVPQESLQPLQQFDHAMRPVFPPGRTFGGRYCMPYEENAHHLSSAGSVEVVHVSYGKTASSTTSIGTIFTMDWSIVCRCQRFIGLLHHARSRQRSVGFRSCSACDESGPSAWCIAQQAVATYMTRRTSPASSVPRIQHVGRACCSGLILAQIRGALLRTAAFAYVGCSCDHSFNYAWGISAVAAVLVAWCRSGYLTLLCHRYLEYCVELKLVVFFTFG
nr:hypothetical protein CFP56_13065 [Quercus suber]